MTIPETILITAIYLGETNCEKGEITPYENKI
jgi:hypothetical protein